jgi:predicted PurR-regulated permease PerM
MSHERAEIPPRWIFAAFFCAGIAIYLLQGILLPFVVAAGLAYVLSPVIDAMQRILRLPRFPAVLLFFLTVFLLCALLLQQFGPSLLRTLGQFNGRAEDIINRSAHDLLGNERITILGRSLDADTLSRQLINKLQTSFQGSGGISHIADLAVKSVFNSFLAIVILFYFLFDGKNFLKRILNLFPGEKRDHVSRLAGKVNSILGRFLTGIFIIVIFTAAVTWPILQFYFHLPYSAPLALVIGVLELIPVAGPLTSGVITSLAAYSYGGVWTAAKIILFYTLLRLVIDQLVGPVVLGKAVTLPPVLIIFSFLAGGTLFGITGLLLAIPVAASIRIIMENDGKSGPVAEDAKSGNGPA